MNDVYYGDVPLWDGEYDDLDANDIFKTGKLSKGFVEILMM